MKKTLLCLSALLLGSVIYSQHSLTPTPVTKPCGVHSAEAKLWAENPAWKAQHEQELLEFNEYVEEFSNSWSPDDRSFYIIPVVVHVVHFGGPENISDEQVYDAIKQLNEDFDAMNEDWGEAVPPFDVLAADMDVEFRLAGLDPDSVCTKGITRTYSSLSFGGSASDVVDAVAAVHGTWSQNDYMNIFVMADLLGPAGYAYFPGSWYAPTSMEGGIYMRSDYMGAIGTSDTSREHRLSHEVGHWLNLEHTWGGDSDNANNPANCSTDDFVGDTPNTIGHYDCLDSAEINCSSADNVQNIMDYSTCQCMFTGGQELRVAAALNSSMGQRNQLWNGTNQAETGVDGSILCAADFAADQTLACIGSYIQFTDVSYNNADSWFWNFEGGTPSFSTDQNPLIQYLTPGTYNVTLQAFNGATDETLIRWQYISVFDTIGAPPLPYTQDFEDLGSPFQFNSFGVFDENDTTEWDVSTVYGYDSDHSAWLKNYGIEDGTHDELISETINLSGIGAGEDIHMQFDYSYKKESADDEEYLRVYISNDCGETWVLRLTLTSDDMTNETVLGPFFPVNDTMWTTEVSVPGITDGFKVETFQYKFVFQNGGGNNVFIDNINIFPAAWLDNTQGETGELRIYPNPTESTLNIDYNTNRNFKYQLFDVSGRLVQTDYLSPQIDVGLFTGGMYLFQILDEQNIAIKTERLIIR